MQPEPRGRIHLRLLFARSLCLCFRWPGPFHPLNPRTMAVQTETRPKSSRNPPLSIVSSVSVTGVFVSAHLTGTVYFLIPLPFRRALWPTGSRSSGDGWRVRLFVQCAIRRIPHTRPTTMKFGRLFLVGGSPWDTYGYQTERATVSIYPVRELPFSRSY